MNPIEKEQRFQAWALLARDFPLEVALRIYYKTGRRALWFWET
jgi:hypothetical protein